MSSVGYDPGAGLSEASAFEERLNAGWYDDPPEEPQGRPFPRKRAAELAAKPPLRFIFRGEHTGYLYLMPPVDFDEYASPVWLTWLDGLLCPLHELALERAPWQVLHWSEKQLDRVHKHYTWDTAAYLVDSRGYTLTDEADLARCPRGEEWIVGPR